MPFVLSVFKAKKEKRTVEQGVTGLKLINSTSSAGVLYFFVIQETVGLYFQNKE